MGRRGVMHAQGGLPAIGLGLAAKFGKRIIPKLAKAGRAVGRKVGKIARRSGPEIAVIGGGAAVGSAAGRGIRRITGGGERKRYRRMNPMNFKALTRAVRRIDAAEKMFRKVLRIRSPEQAKRSIVPKSKRR